jgi:flagellar protein FlaJ
MATARARAGVHLLGRRRPTPGVSRPVRLKKGEQPTHSALTGLQMWAWRTFRAKVTRLPPDHTLEDNLVKAHMRIRADEYLAYTMGLSVIVTIATFVLGAALTTFFYLFLGLGYVSLLPVILFPILGYIGTNFGMRGTPGSRSKARSRAIDRKISAGMNFMSAMASADVTIDQIFQELAKQKIYGEVANEAAWITRDTELLGVDILTAIKDGAARTPSKRFQDFLQGVVTTATSGGQLKPYFLLKAEQYERENKLDQTKRTESMGLFAEIFVIGVVAFPLFLIIILAIFAIIGGNGSFVLLMLWVIVGAAIPAFEFVFIFLIRTMALEA